MLLRRSRRAKFGSTCWGWWTACGCGASAATWGTRTTTRPGTGAFPFAESGAIDVLYAGGAGGERFGASVRGSDTFGSDHDPVAALLAE